MNHYLSNQDCKTITCVHFSANHPFMQKHAKEIERLSEHTKRLPPLKVRDHVRLQNQTGNAPLKWDRTGEVVEVRQFDQYAVKIHGSGRVTLRNRKFLRKYTPPTSHSQTGNKLVTPPVRFIHIKIKGKNYMSAS